MSGPVFLLHRTGEPWVGDWLAQDDRDVTEKTFPDVTAALQSTMGQRWTLYQVEPQADETGKAGWRILDRPF